MIDLSVKLGRTRPSLALRTCARWVESGNWHPEDRPDIVACLIESFGFRLRDHFAYEPGEGWARQRANGRYYARSDTDALVTKICDSRPARTNFMAATTALAEVTGELDLGFWSQEISEGVEDVVRVLDEAAELLRTRGH